MLHSVILEMSDGEHLARGFKPKPQHFEVGWPIPFLAALYPWYMPGTHLLLGTKSRVNPRMKALVSLIPFGDVLSQKNLFAMD